MKINPNDPAFPVTCSTDSSGNSTYLSSSVAKITSTGGLTVRAHIASLALQGMLSYNESPTGRSTRFAQNAVEYADALIAELNK